jgi:aspartate kinase
MIVMKFGGTSVEDASSIARVAEIIKARLSQGPLVVVSAMGKTTRKLLEAASASAVGDRQGSLRIVADLKTRHLSEVRRAIPKPSLERVVPQLELYFDELKVLLEGLAILGEVPARGLDKILAYGELLSSTIVSAAFVESGINARLLDSRELIKTDDRYGSASPIFEITNPLIEETVGPRLRDGEVPVLQGFIGSTREGATTTLGFEGSDYTASIVGAALGVEDIQIWKDVSGLMTADPAIYRGARTVKACSYVEAGELTYFGAKVLHPKAIKPAERKQIPVHIYNSKQPHAVGTEITSRSPRCSNAIKSIAYTRPITIINATFDPGRASGIGASPNEWLRGMLNALNRHRIEPLITAVSGSNVVLAINSRFLTDLKLDQLLESISQFGDASAVPGKAIVSLVGEQLRADSSSIGRAFEALETVKPALILHGSSRMTLNLVVDESRVEETVARLHGIYFEKLDPEVFE